MAYTEPPPVITGDLMTAAQWNLWVKDNFIDHEARIAAGGTPPHYRVGVKPTYVAADKIRVSPGTVEIDSDKYQETIDSAVLDTDVAGDYISGVSEKGANKWLYVYVKGDGDGGWTPKFSDDPPLYPNCDDEFAWTAQVNGNPAANATSIPYDGAVGTLAAQDVVRVWTDADYTIVRGGWEVVTPSATPMTVEANNVDAADDDRMTIVHGEPHYRLVGATWWRKVGAVRLDGDQNILEFYPPTNDGLVLYKRYWQVLADGAAVGWTTVSCAAYAPPYARRMLVFLFVSTALDYGYIRKTGSDFQQVFAFDGTTIAPVEVSPNQAVDYFVGDAASRMDIDVSGWYEEL